MTIQSEKFELLRPPILQARELGFFFYQLLIRRIYYRLLKCSDVGVVIVLERDASNYAPWYK